MTDHDSLVRVDIRGKTIVIKIVPFWAVPSETYCFDWKTVQHTLRNCTVEIWTSTSHFHFMKIPAQFFIRLVWDQVSWWTVQTTKAQSFYAKLRGLSMPFIKVWRSKVLLKGRCETLPTTHPQPSGVAIYAMLCLCLYLLLSMWDTKCPLPLLLLLFPCPTLVVGRRAPPKELHKCRHAGENPHCSCMSTFCVYINMNKAYLCSCRL